MIIKIHFMELIGKQDLRFRQGENGMIKTGGKPISSFYLCSFKKEVTGLAYSIFNKRSDKN